jgi:hypothetical protein
MVAGRIANLLAPLLGIVRSAYTCCGLCIVRAAAQPLVLDFFASDLAQWWVGWIQIHGLHFVMFNILTAIPVFAKAQVELPSSVRRIYAGSLRDAENNLMCPVLRNVNEPWTGVFVARCDKELLTRKPLNCYDPR